MAVPVKYDIIVAGGGLAGLSLLYRATKAGLWQTEKILVIDRSAKTENDRTWSFWKSSRDDTITADFDPVISHRWTDLVFFANNGKRINLESRSYSYHSIHSIDFYRYVMTWLSGFPNISFVNDDITGLNSADGFCTVDTAAESYQATYVFNSIYTKPALLQGEQYFLQHFKGLRIRTSSLIPPLHEAYLMDFRTGQEHGTTFFYTLPMAADELFVEYTLFSKSLLAPEAYDQQLKLYIKTVLKIQDYDILDEEFGAIPMTDHRFERFEGNIIHMGTQGGDTRASTGYTFTNTQKTIGKIVARLQQTGDPFFKTETIGLKTQLYDATLLNVLAQRQYEGHQLFYDLFSKTPAHRIFAFLDAETSIPEDVHIMKSLRVLPFLRAFTTAVLQRILHSA